MRGERRVAGEKGVVVLCEGVRSHGRLLWRCATFGLLQAVYWE